MKSEQGKNFKLPNIYTNLVLNRLQSSLVEEGLVSQFNWHFDHRLESYDSFYKWLYEFPKLVRNLRSSGIDITRLNCGYDMDNYTNQLRRETRDTSCAFKCYLFNEYFEIETGLTAHRNDLINTGLISRNQLGIMQELTQFDLLHTPLPKLRQLLTGLAGKVVWEDMCYRYFYKTLACSPSIIS